MQAIGFLLMAFSFLGVPLGLALWLYAHRTGRTALARTLLLIGGGWAVLYLSLLLTTSLMSREQVLDQGQRKAFCGFYLDCHLGVAVKASDRTKQIGEGAQAITADGVYQLTTVEVSSDARRATLSLINPDAVLLDAQGRTYHRSAEAENRWAASRKNPTIFPAKIQQGQAVTKTLIFDVPADAVGLKLHFTTGYAVDHIVETFLIGDDDSLLHRKTLLKV